MTDQDDDKRWLSPPPYNVYVVKNEYGQPVWYRASGQTGEGETKSEAKKRADKRAFREAAADARTLAKEEDRTVPITCRGKIVAEVDQGGMVTLAQLGQKPPINTRQAPEQAETRL